jgi:hypothetical protein
MRERDGPLLIVEDGNRLGAATGVVPLPCGGGDETPAGGRARKIGSWATIYRIVWPIDAAGMGKKHKPGAIIYPVVDVTDIAKGDPGEFFC